MPPATPPGPPDAPAPPASAPPALEYILVDKNDTSWSMRPWLLLVHHGIPFTETSLVAADPATPGRLRVLSPTGKVPVLVVDGQPVWESLAIIEAIADLRPDLAIWPRDPAARRHARAVAAEMHAGFGELRRHCTMNLALRTRVTLDPARRAELDRFERLVEGARAQAAQAGWSGAEPFLFGAFTAADAMLAPVATRIVSYGLDVGPVTRAWVEAIFALPAFQRWEAEAAAERAVRPPADHVGTPLAGRLEERVPAGPCFAVIFENQRRARAPGGAPDDYGDTAERMVELARGMPGYLGHVSARNPDGAGVTVSYWASLADIARFRAVDEHAAAQRAGRERYYASYTLRVARVERTSAFTAT